MCLHVSDGHGFGKMEGTIGVYLMSVENIINFINEVGTPRERGRHRI